MQATALTGQSTAHEIVTELSCTNTSCACQRAVRKGTGLTHCPVHEDHTPSLNVSFKDGVLLVHCQTGSCTQEQVIDELRMRGIWPQNEAPPTHRTIVATYDYRDVHGNVLYQAVRFSPKGFSQRRPNGSGGWIWNLTGVKRVLFNLPELLAADPKRLRIIVEGEKDVETLTRQGFVATSNVGGAGKWADEYSEWFRDMNVCLIVDNDEPGRKHMVQVARSLQGIAHSIRWLALPSLKLHGDVTDWIEAGGSVETLKELIRVAPLFTDELVIDRSDDQLVDIDTELYLLYNCAHDPNTVTFLQPDDFSSASNQLLFKAIRAGEPVNIEGLPEPPDSFDDWAGIVRLRDLNRRRMALRIAEQIIAVVSDTGRTFNPCIAAESLKKLCEHYDDKAGSGVKLSDILDLA